MEVTPKSAILTVKNADKEDESAYRAELENDLGKDKADLNAEVVEKEGARTSSKVVNLQIVGLVTTLFKSEVVYKSSEDNIYNFGFAGPPKIDLPPELRGNKPVTVNKGEDLVLKVPYTGRPKPKVCRSYCFLP